MDVFEKLDVWKRSCRLSVNVYGALHSCRDYGIRDQITRSALSAPSNIAEGYERDSGKEYMRFLRIAKGSCGELRTQLYIAREIGVLEAQQARDFISEAVEISKMQRGLIKKLEAQRE